MRRASEVALEATKIAWATSDARRDRGLVEPEDVACVRDVPYGPDGAWNLLDVCLPRDASAPLPTFVNVHGGGYFYGTKDTGHVFHMDARSDVARLANDDEVAWLVSHR